MTDLQFYFAYCSMDGITIKNLIHKMYYFLLLDNQFVFKYNLNSNGIFSNPMNSAINEFIAMDFLEVKNNLIYPSQNTYDILEETGILLSEQDILNKLDSMLNELTDQELEEGIATHLLIDDYSKKYGWVNFKDYTSDFIKTMQGLYVDYDRKLLNKLIKILNYIEENKF